MKDVHIIGGRNFLDSIDFLATNHILPMGSMLIAVFTGWVLTTRLARGEIEKGSVRFHLYPVWHFLIRYVSPILVALVLLNKMGIFLQANAGPGQPHYLPKPTFPCLPSG